MKQTTTLTIGKHSVVEVCQAEGRELIGLGAAHIAGVPLRSAARPLAVRLDTPTGILYTRLVVQEIEQRPDGAARIITQALGLPWGRGEYADDYDQAMVWLDSPTEAVSDRLVLELAPVELALGGRTWRGFSYAFRFQSDAREVHRLLTLATWEIGGAITGNTVLHQGQCNMPVYRGAADALFTTTCLKTLNQYGSPQGVSYQLAPRGGLLQAFDFQYAPPGALLQYWPELTSISSLLESPVGSDLLHVIDEYRFPLSSEITTPEKWVLFCPGDLAEHEARNLWWDAHEMVNAEIRRPFRIAPTVVVPELRPRYSTRVVDGGLKMTVAPGIEVDSREVPYAVGDHVIPRLARAGVRRFFPEVMSESDVTVLGMRRKLDAGIHGDLCCGSICATHRFLPAEFWGGMKGWRYMADKARAHGIEIGAWFSTALSPRAAILAEHPEYRMLAVNFRPWSGGYGIQAIATMDCNYPDYVEWLLEDIRRWKEEGGLDYLFTDSWSNLNLLGFNYACGMCSNLTALGRLYGELQRLGIKVFSFEGISPFGISEFGAADLRGDLLDARQGVVGQNDFGWWVNEEDMAYGISLGVHTRMRTTEELAQIQFRLMANRGFALYEDQYDLHYSLPEWWVRLNAIYNQALPHMKTRLLLPDRMGVAWEDGEITVVWAYREGIIRLPPAAAVDVLTGDAARRLSHDGELSVQAHTVYRITGTPVTPQVLAMDDRVHTREVP